MRAYCVIKLAFSSKDSAYDWMSLLKKMHLTLSVFSFTWFYSISCHWIDTFRYRLSRCLTSRKGQYRRMRWVRANTLSTIVVLSLFYLARAFRKVSSSCLLLCRRTTSRRKTYSLGDWS